MISKKLLSLLILGLLFLTLQIRAFSQSTINDSLKLDYRTIYSHCLEGDVSTVLHLLQATIGYKLSASDEDFKGKFESRFKYSDDQSGYLKERRSAIDSLLFIFQIYWRSSLLDTSKTSDSTLINQVCNHLSYYHLKTFSKKMCSDSIDVLFKQYIKVHRLYATDGIGKTGKLYDLLVWRHQKDTVYTFIVNKEKISTRIIFMDDFITLGWEEYATLNRFYPGGWATDEALYCVKKAYDLNSEDFLVSYLAHEGRHFMDYRLFPKLKNSADLEYRAKLTELILAKSTLYQLIEFFISNSNKESQNGHQIANYYVIGNLSRLLFKKDFEGDIEKWKTLPARIINKAAAKALAINTKALNKNAKNIERYFN